MCIAAVITGTTRRAVTSIIDSTLPSSTIAADQPIASFMEEGKDKDDRYRMVEDELFKIAQTYTVHLHAAEYKRQQKAVKSQNADTINTISRPVTGIMTDHAKRKAEAVAIAKRQRLLIEGIRGKRSGNVSDESEDEGLPYVGTTLHGLMDSPRKKAASLAKLGTKATTRAAAGFGKAALQHKPAEQFSPVPKHATRPVLAPPQDEGATSTEDDDDDDDDLDAPIVAPKLNAADPKPSSIRSVSLPTSMCTPLIVPTQESRDFTSLEQTPQHNTTKESPPTIPARSASTSIPVGGAPRLSRLERIRQKRALKAEEADGK